MLSVTWNDARIYFKTLQNKVASNIIPNFDEIWMPNIKVLNSLHQHEFTEDDITVTAKKHGLGLLNGDDVLLMDKIYNGNEINITKQNKLTGAFHCSFHNLAMYPFDTEICTMDLQVDGNDYRFTKLIPKVLKYHGQQTLGNYIIKGASKFKTKINLLGKTGLEVEIKLGRKISSIFLVTYLPTILMNVINQMTNYFKGDDIFGNVIMINLTCMMVLSALYISVSNSLPVTSSIKYVEIWLLFSLVYPFFVVSIQTWIHTCKMENITNDRVTPILTCLLYTSDAADE